MKSINTIKDAFVEIEDDKIIDFGSMDQWKGIDNWNETEIIDAEGGMVFPTYCDSHTHLVFAASREGEFQDRINGLSYQEIAEKGVEFLILPKNYKTQVKINYSKML